MTNLPEPFEVVYSAGVPDCPMCHGSIMMQCTVEITGVDLRITGGTHFQSNMTPTIGAKVVKVTADHSCIPDKD